MLVCQMFWLNLLYWCRKNCNKIFRAENNWYSKLFEAHHSYGG